MESALSHYKSLKSDQVNGLLLMKQPKRESNQFS